MHRSRRSALALSLLALAGALLALTACGSPEVPDTSDTPKEAAAPFPIVELAPEAVPKPVQAVEYTDLTEALRNLDFDFLRRHSVEGPERRFGEALEQVFVGRPDVALAELETLQRQPAAATFGPLLTALVHNLMDNVGRHADILASPGGLDSGPITPLLAAMPAEQTSFTPEPFSDRLRLGVTGSPLVEIEINGERREVWLDTGADLSLLSTSWAEELGVTVETPNGLQVGTSTTIQVRSGLGTVDRLWAGRLRLENHPVLIIDDSQLTFELQDGTPFKIGGILGWNAIRKVRVELDYGKGTYLIEPSAAEVADDPSLFWLGYPMTRALGPDGETLLFGIDTGSRNTSVTRNIYSKLTLEQRTETVEIGGVGGVVETETEIVAELPLILGRHRFELREIQRENPDDAIFVHMDGVLGSDLARSCRMVIDFPSARFELIPST